MINKKLFHMTGGARKWLWISVLCNYLNSILYMAVLLLLATVMQRVLLEDGSLWQGFEAFLILIILILTRMWTSRMMVASASRYANRAKRILRQLLYRKVSRQDVAGRSGFSTSELAQTAADGIDQLDAYFGRYIPQVFSTMLIPPTVFIFLLTFDWRAAVVLLCCVPLIPASIMVIRKMARGQSGRFWGEYVRLGDRFLENLRGLTTLKVFQMDGQAHQEMNRAAERFRTSIMTVLKGQLNSITVMDFIVYGGAGAGIAVALTEAANNRISLIGLILFLFLSVEFFMPLRYLGSLFHVAMTGVSAAERLFQFLDLPEAPHGENRLDEAPQYVIAARHFGFSYDGTQAVLQAIDFDARTGERVALIGESGSGKSTVAALFSGLLHGYTGTLTINGVELSSLSPDEVFQKISLMSSESRLFTGSVGDNLRLGNPEATDDQLVEALRRVNLGSFLDTLENGLATPLTENGGNLSGGQRQRLIMARLLLADRPICIFDEATANVDADSEDIMLGVMRELAREKLVIVIAHRMYAIRDADRIYVLDHGRLVQSGTHDTLITAEGRYRAFVMEEKRLEEGVGSDA